MLIKDKKVDNNQKGRTFTSSFNNQTINTMNIQAIKSTINEYNQMIETPILQKCNWIVEVGFASAGTNDENQVILTNAKFPTQFTESSAKAIKSMDWNGRKVRMVDYKTWYQERIAEMEETLELV